MILIGSMPTSAQNPVGSSTSSASAPSSAPSSSDLSSSAASNSSWAASSAAASTSGVVTTASSASSTSSQRSATTLARSVHSSAPSRPVNGRVPCGSRSNPAAESSTSCTFSRSHTSASERTIATMSASSPITQVSGSSATSSGTPTRSNWWSTSGIRSVTDSPGTTDQAGWSMRSCSSAVRTNAARWGASGKAYRSSSLPRNASHSSPSSRHRGAHSVTRSPWVSPSSIGTMS